MCRLEFPSFLRENDGVGPYAVAGADAVLYGIRELYHFTGEGCTVIHLCDLCALHMIKTSMGFIWP